MGSPNLCNIWLCHQMQLRHKHLNTSGVFRVAIGKEQKAHTRNMTLQRETSQTLLLTYQLLLKTFSRPLLFSGDSQNWSKGLNTSPLPCLNTVFPRHVYLISSICQALPTTSSLSALAKCPLSSCLCLPSFAQEWKLLFFHQVLLLILEAVI